MVDRLVCAGVWRGRLPGSEDGVEIAPLGTLVVLDTEMPASLSLLEQVVDLASRTIHVAHDGRNGGVGASPIGLGITGNRPQQELYIAFGLALL